MHSKKINKNFVGTDELNASGMKNQNSWDGNAHLANEVFGESYGVDWVYAGKGPDIIVKGKLIKVGDTI